MRRLAILLAMAGLSACGMVTSERPLFTAADSRGGPVVKNGVWAWMNEPDCQVDPRAKVQAWPKCAEAFVVRDGRMTELRKTGLEGRDASPLIVAGDPPLIQMSDAPDGEGKRFTAYAAFRPTDTDRSGRITALGSWLVLCVRPTMTNGRQDPVDPKNVLPGFTLREDGGGDCSVDSQDNVREAARASEAWFTPQERYAARWIRNGTR